MRHEAPEVWRSLPAAEIETASERDALHDDLQHAGAAERRRRACMLALAVTTVLAIAASVRTPFSHTPKKRLISREAGPPMHLHIEVEADRTRTGCSNWWEIQLQPPQRLPNASRCRALCAASAGCASYNFQPVDCPKSEGEGLGPGACYVFGGGCEEAADNCWDLYHMSPPTPGWELRQTRTGCSNWESILVGETVTKSVKDCGVQCAKDKNCKQFGYQYEGDCSKEKSKVAGACYLYNGSCSPERNECWDLFDYTAIDVVLANISFLSNASSPADQAHAQLEVNRTILAFLGATADVMVATPVVQGPLQGLYSFIMQVRWADSRNEKTGKSSLGTNKVFNTFNSIALNSTSFVNTFSKAMSQGHLSLSGVAVSRPVRVVDSDSPSTTTPVATTTRSQ